MSRRRIIIILIIVAVFGWTKYWSPTNKTGDLAPDISATLADGSTFQLSDLRGQYVLLDFWGSWCPPCRKDNRQLVHLYNTFHGKSFKDASDFEIVSIALEKTERHWQKAIQKDGLHWKYQILRLSKFVMADPLAISYQVKDLPSKFLINPQGEIVGVNMTREEIEAYLRPRQR